MKVPFDAFTGPRLPSQETDICMCVCCPLWSNKFSVLLYDAAYNEPILYVRAKEQLKLDLNTFAFVRDAFIHFFEIDYKLLQEPFIQWSLLRQVQWVVHHQFFSQVVGVQQTRVHHIHTAIVILKCLETRQGKVTTQSTVKLTVSVHKPIVSFRSYSLSISFIII